MPSASASLRRDSPVVWRPITTLLSAASARRAISTTCGHFITMQRPRKKRWCEPQKWVITRAAGCGTCLPSASTTCAKRCFSLTRSISSAVEKQPCSSAQKAAAES